ncbi:MAG: hypothetical protein IPH62_19385 [Ignavibacteriae bacterium]|nr:hypothetical protein [Ignavibacteriota bacterium]
MKKTVNKWNTEKCGRCGKSHSGYTGKLDSEGKEYVICEITNKKMEVSEYIDSDLKSIIFSTKWYKSS